MPASDARPSAETLALLAARRSTPIGMMTGPGPTRAETEALIRLAARVPDHGKLGPWRFIAYEGASRDAAGEKLAAILAQDGIVDETQLTAERARLTRAPVVVMVVSTAAPHKKIPEWEQLLSAGAVCFSLLTTAHAAGFAGAWLTEWPVYDERARAALGLAEHERIAGFVYLGTAKIPPKERVRPSVDERLRWA